MPAPRTKTVLPTLRLTSSEAVEWSPLTKCRGNRPVTVTALIPMTNGRKEQIHFIATVRGAKAVTKKMTWLVRHREHGPQSILDVFKQSGRNGRLIRFKAEMAVTGGASEEVQIRTTKAAFEWLRQDSEHWAKGCRHDPRAIRQSVLWNAFHPWEVDYSKEDLLKEAMKKDGPWILAFAERVCRQRAEHTSHDDKILACINEHAERMGFDCKEFFYSSTKKRRLLKWLLIAYLVELCTGGADAWRDKGKKGFVWIPPVRWTGSVLERQRNDRTRSGDANIFKRHFGDNWKTLRRGSPRRIPNSIQRIMIHHSIQRLKSQL